MIYDHYDDSWNERIRKIQENEEINKQFGGEPYFPSKTPLIPQRDIDEFYKLLERAREYDKRNNEPDCEMESKKEKIRDLAKQLGIEDKVYFL